MFFVRPSTFNTAPPHATISEHAVEITFSGPQLNSTLVKSEFEAKLKSIKEYLGWLGQDFSQFNATLKQATFGALNQRKQRLQQSQDFVSGLGYKVQE